MRLACIVLAHREPQQVARLLSTLQHERVRHYLHVDRRVDIAPFARALAEAGLTSVTLLRRHRTPWGAAGVVDAILEGITSGLSDGCGYFTLISGQDFPIMRIERIVDFFEAAGSASYVEHFELPVEKWRFGGRDRIEFYSYDLFGRRETCIPRGENTSFLNWKGRIINEALRVRSALRPPRRFPPYLRPVGGWLWWNLSLDAARYVLRFVADHPDYRGFHEDSLSPDELFFQSILLGTSFAERHEIVNDSLRFTKWKEGSSHPEILERGDLLAMISSGKLFARKFDPKIDDSVLRELQGVLS